MLGIPRSAFRCAYKNTSGNIPEILYYLTKKRKGCFRLDLQAVDSFLDAPHDVDEVQSAIRSVMR